MKASDLLVDALEREGVAHVFGIPGEEMEALLFSLRDSNITFVPTRHEQGAAFMADVHGRLTGDSGVCLATLGPGATNLLTGVADAHLDKSPVVAITAQGDLERLHKESHQRLEIVDLFDAVTKWNTRISDPDIVHEAVRKAFKTAEYQKPGATHLELPEDVAAGETSTEPLPARPPPKLGPPSMDAVERALDLFDASRRPLVVVGNGAIRVDASAQLRQFVASTDVPAVSTYMGKGAIPDDDGQSLLTVESGADGEAATAIEEADLIIGVGYDIAEHDPTSWNHEDGRVVHVDSEPAEVYQAYNPDAELVGDIGESLAIIEDGIADHSIEFDTDWYGSLREQILEDIYREPTAQAPFTVRGVLPVLRQVMDREDVLVSDVGSHKMAIAQNFLTYEPNTCIISNGLASMGIGVPGGLAADLAVDANVVVGTGDGGFLMNAAELETATRLGCEFTVLVFNDDDYGMISQEQRDHLGESFGTELTNPDFVSFAESFGIDGFSPESAAQLRDVLERTISDGMSVIEIPVK